MKKFKAALASLQKDSSSDNLEKQVSAILAEMTLREKIILTSGQAVFPFFVRLLYGVIRGSFLYLPFLGGGCRRLGIPRITFSDGPRGVVSGRSTCFPVAMMRAATFDEDLEYRIGRAIAKELNAVGANFFGGVCINIVRNPRWGRAQESYGEDPFLLGRMGSKLTSAVQEEGIIACSKHFAMNSIENLRFQVSANTDERTLHEIYLPHFKKCIDAGALAVMSAYNRVNGVYCGENKHLLTDILRGEWGFQGFVMSDFVYGVHDCKNSYEAGLDSEMPWRTHHKKAARLINKGQLDVKVVDQAATRIIRALLLSTPRVKSSQKDIVKSAEHLALAREAAVKGTVLLKNNGVLPLAAQEHLAVVGPYADTVNTGDQGSSYIWNKDGITPYQGLKTTFNEVTLYNGLEIEPALQAAARANVVIVCVGSDSRREGELLENKIEVLEKDPSKKRGGDRDSLRLSPAEINLIQALKKAGKKVIVSLLSGSVFLTGDIEEYVDAILMSFYGGVQAGQALADLLSGKVSPSGKLPVTIAKCEADYPPFLKIGQKPYEIDYGYYLGYMLFDKSGVEPQYPFGFGLSYTTFALGTPVVTRTDYGISVNINVTNTGLVEGAEVVQVYVGSAGAEDDRPVKQLKGFQRISLQPGESRDVSIKVLAEDLKFYHPERRVWELDQAYYVYIGTDCRGAVKQPGIISFRQENNP